MLPSNKIDKITEKVKTIRSLLTNSLIILAVVAVMIILLHDLYKQRVVIFPATVRLSNDHAISEDGTAISKALNKRLISVLYDVMNQSDLRQPVFNMSLNSFIGQHYKSQLSELPDFEVPELGVSISTVSDYIKRSLDIRIVPVSVDILISDTIEMTLNVNGTIRKVPSIGNLSNTSSLDKALDQAAFFIAESLYPYQVGIFYSSINEFNDALRVSKMLLNDSLKVNDLAGYLILSEIMYRSGKPQESLYYLDKCLKLVSDSSSSDQNYDTICILIARSYLQTGDYSRANYYIDLAGGENKSSQFYENKSILAFLNSDIDSAHYFINKIDSRSYRVALINAEIQLAKGDTLNAIKYYEEALHFDAFDYQTHYSLCRLYLFLSNQDVEASILHGKLALQTELDSLKADVYEMIVLNYLDLNELDSVLKYSSLSISMHENEKSESDILRIRTYQDYALKEQTRTSYLNQEYELTIKYGARYLDFEFNNSKNKSIVYQLIGRSLIELDQVQAGCDYISRASKIGVPEHRNLLNQFLANYCH